MVFPKLLVGRCPVCGGGDEGSGYELLTYRGRVMCQMCRKDIMADEESLVMSDIWNEEEKFRKKVGFVNKIT